MKEQSSLKTKTVGGLAWSLADLAGNQGVQFVIQIVLARLLLPEHFGLIGIVLIFVAISNSIVDSGFTQALIREKNPTQTDFSTVFYFNLAVSVSLYACIYAAAPAISSFFGHSELILLIRVLSLSIIIKSFELVPRVLLIRDIDFKTQAAVNLVGSLLSGGVAIGLAMSGFGIWSLIARILLLTFLQTLLLAAVMKWIPSLVFSTASFLRMFRFGWKLLVSGLIDTLSQNIFMILIGRQFSALQLGYYTNASKFSDVATQSLTSALQRVTYPVLSRMQDDDKRLKVNYRKIIRLTAFLVFPMLIGMAAIAEPLIRIVFGVKWEAMTIYFQLLCVAGMLYPIHALNLNILQVKGRSDLFLYLEILKLLITSSLVFVAVWSGFGMVGLLAALVADSFLSLFLNMYCSGREIGYTVKQQVGDLLPVFLLAVAMGTIVYSLGSWLLFSDMAVILIQIAAGTLFYAGAAKGMKMMEFQTVLNILLPILRKMKPVKAG